jgi:sulfite exporter TauE/SafE
MSQELAVLTATAASIGLVHTLLGPDHYLPFVVLSRARQWSLPRTAGITVLCGLGHVASSVVLGFVGIALGVAVARLAWIEAVRGDVAAWLLTAFGFIYMVWGLRRARRDNAHRHIHVHGGDAHSHGHDHQNAHAHAHNASIAANLTPWILFTIFVFGPCEPLIPLLMYPAAASDSFGVILVAAAFGVVTITTMLAVVLLLTFGLQRLPTGGLERWSHAVAGAAILVCGLAIHLGL